MTSNPAIKDARGGLPSASQMTRIYNCPASFKLNSLEFPESSAAAEEGTLLHKLCELLIKDALNHEDSAKCQELVKNISDEQIEIVDWATAKVKKLIEDSNINRIVMTEQRLWSNSGLFSGQADVTIIEEQYKHATIIDYKFGRGDVEPAERNYQLSALAVLAFENYGVETVTAIIIQPRSLDKGKRITECTYDKPDLEAASEAINVACKEATEAEKPAQNSGYWCNYCPSAYRCKAAQAEISEQCELATATPSTAITEHNARELFEKANIVKKYCDAILAKVKDFVLDNPETNCGLRLKDGARRSKLGDAEEIFNLISDVGITAEEFVGCCDVGMTKLSTLYHKHRKATNDKQTQKTSKDEIKDLLENAGLLTYTQNAPTLTLSEGE